MIKQAPERMAYARAINKTEVDRDYYGTPPKFIKRARQVMGSIELDPASCEEANLRFVQAERFYDEKDNGLEQSWKCNTLWMNPPYSRIGCRDFAEKFAAEAHHIKQAVVLVNSATGTRAFRYLFDACDAICFCNQRIQFLQTDGRVSTSSNSKEQLFFYKGRRLKKFYDTFSPIGKVVRTKW